MKRFKSVRKPLLSEEVERQLRASISAGIYKPGDKLPSERELVNQFEVSRVTVRDALRNLQNLGLISVRRGVNAGAYVSEPTPQPITQSINNLIQMKKVNFAHLIEIRLYIEPEIARTAAICRTSEDLDTLSQLLDQAEKYITKSRKKAHLSNVRFHNELAKVTRNALIVFLSESITQVYSSMIIEMTRAELTKEDVKKLLSDHRAILDAIAGQDPERAFSAAKQHLIDAYYTYSVVMPHIRDGEVSRRIEYLASL